MFPGRYKGVKLRYYFDSGIDNGRIIRFRLETILMRSFHEVRYDNVTLIIF